MVGLSVFIFFEFAFQYSRSTKMYQNHEQHFGDMFQKIKELTEVQFILDVTSSVSLRPSPPIFPKGFTKIFEHFGGSVGETFTIPFSGQHSCFSTSSGGLKKSITAFLSGCDAYNIASFPQVGMGTLQDIDVRDFNITIIMLSISQLSAIANVVVPVVAAACADLPLFYHRKATMNQSKMAQPKMVWKHIPNTVK